MSRQPTCPLCRQEYTVKQIDDLNSKIGLTNMTLTPKDKYTKIWEWTKNQAKKLAAAQYEA